MTGCDSAKTLKRQKVAASEHDAEVSTLIIYQTWML